MKSLVLSIKFIFIRVCQRIINVQYGKISYSTVRTYSIKQDITYFKYNPKCYKARCFALFTRRRNPAALDLEKICRCWNLKEEKNQCISSYLYLYSESFGKLPVCDCVYLFYWFKIVHLSHLGLEMAIFSRIDRNASLRVQTQTCSITNSQG